MRVRLTAKLADVVDGIDISRYQEGDIIEVSDHDGKLLVAEGWAEMVAVRNAEIAWASRWTERAEAADAGPPERKRSPE